MNYLGTEIFWTSLLALVGVLSLSALIGRALCATLPFSLGIRAKFYLSPALGLALLTLVSTALGWVVPLGGSVLVPLVVVSMLIFAVVREPRSRVALKYALAVSIFGLGCAAIVWGALYAFGAFRVNNDAPTYLAHAQWLQDHAFRSQVRIKEATPSSGQISLYQQMGFRMGGSFLLAMLQALLNAPFAYQIYPAAVMSAVSVCCLAAGFPLTGILRRIPREKRLLLLSLPAFTAGGLVSGATNGFLPQTLGLALGGAAIFLVGPVLMHIARGGGRKNLLGLALPTSVLLASVAYAYSELAPFLILTVGLSWLYFAARSRHRIDMLLFAGICAALLLAFLNIELLRAYRAIRLQSGVVVGNAVDWPAFGFLVHALGAYGGDTQQPFPFYSKLGALVGMRPLIVLETILVVGLSILGFRLVRFKEARQALVPIVVMLGVLGLTFIYFRFFVVSPFSSGQGQSWNQYKVSEWAHPFAMVLIVAVLGSIFLRAPAICSPVLGLVFLGGFLLATMIGLNDIRPLSRNLGSRDVFDYYMHFRSAILKECPGRVYFAVPQHDQAFRRVASVFLFDRRLASDWTDDPYILRWISPSIRNEQPIAGDCVIESNRSRQWTRDGIALGPYWIGTGELSERASIASVKGAYGRESDGDNWWYWVNKAIVFKLNTSAISEASRRTDIKFEYASAAGQRLTFKIVGADGQVIPVDLKPSGFPVATYEGLVDLSAAQISELVVETSEPASRLGPNDPRIAAFLVRNLEVSAGPK